MKLIRLTFILCLIWCGCKASGGTRLSVKEADKELTDFFTEFRKWNIKEQGPIPPEKVAPFLGHGGTYESVQQLVSKTETIESDHAPHNSILQYVDPNNENLPDNIRNAVAIRKSLEAKLASTDFAKNNEMIKSLKEKIGLLENTRNANKPFRVNQWNKIDRGLQDEYYKNIAEMKKLLTENKQLKKNLKTSSDATLENKINNIDEMVNNLEKRNKEVRKIIEAEYNSLSLEKLRVEKHELESVNKGLSKALDIHNDNIKKAMGVLSIPYDIHRIFPSTGQTGLDKKIRGLKTADAAAAKAAMEEYDKLWKSQVDEGIELKFIKNADMFAKKTEGGDFELVGGKKVYDYQAIWEHNFDHVKNAVQNDKKTSTGSKSKKRKKGSHKTESEFLTDIHGAYAKKFMTTTIYFVKTPEAGYSRLQNLYIKEYKLYLKDDFDSYKVGIVKLLGANKQFGWITETEVGKMSRQHNLEVVMSDPSPDIENKWNLVEEQVKLKSEKSSNPIIPNANSASTSTASNNVCSPSARQKRSSPGNCIFFTKPKDADTDIDTKKGVRPNVDGDDLPGPKIRLPSDSDTVSIDSKRLLSYLNDLDGGDIESVRTKEAVIEFASKNADKLTGTSEEIAEARAKLKQEDLNFHSEKTTFGGKILRANGAGDIPPKSMSKYQKMKISASKVANKLGKFTKVSNKFSNPYGKIMLAKGVITALRHGDYESLALMGGRIGLEVALSGVTKLGKYIAKKATTKFVTKFGSQFLGKLAGPVGAIADIGINIYSITKSVKILNDPNASKFDRNAAIADIVADSIDIAVTATAAVLSLVFPPLAPVFAAVAFITNLVTTFVVAFYKAANHVDRINEQLPLLGFEKTREYWRYIGGRDTSGYIQELIDTKRANNIAVNMTVQFLKNNPDYIGRVFPSRTLYQPEAPCWLERQECGKLLHFIPLKCKDWKWLSNCGGYGRYCEGKYSDWKCQSDSGTGIVIPLFPLAGRSDWEYRCKCGSEPAPQWGYEIQDSVVDFRYQQNVYLQRAAPDFAVPNGFTYLCKPSSLSNEGERVSWPWTERAYYCKGAIGIRRSYSQGKFMLYDLGEGTDTVYLDTSESVDNLFIVKDGFKRYEGNAGDDTFLLDGPCNYFKGWLDGKEYKSQGNSLVLGSNCKTGETLEVNLISSTMWFGGYSLNIDGIQRVIGRQRKTDIIHASCTTKLIVGSGGRSVSDPDQVYLPGSCSSQTEITVVLEGSGTVYATSFSGGKAFVLLQDTGLTFNAKAPSSLPSGTLLFKFQESVGKLTSARINSQRATIELQFGRGGSTASFELGKVSTAARQATCSSSKTSTDENPIQIVISENSKFCRQLSFDLKPSEKLQAIHVLERESASRIHGYDFMDNVFHLKSGQWHVSGGRGRMNHFILKSSQFSGSIDGTSPSQSTLQISNDVRLNPIRIDFNLGKIQDSIIVKNIQRLVGRPDYIEEVIAACTVKYLELGGNARDIVNIPSTSYCSPEVRISAKGKLQVEDRKSSGATIIEAGYFDPCVGRSREKLDLHINNFGGGATTLLLNFPISTLTTATPNFLNVDGEGGGKVFMQGAFPNVYFEESHNIKSALVLDDMKKVVAFHELKVAESIQSAPKIRKGSNVIPNIFKLENGKNWKVDGSNEGDVFSFVDSKFSGSLDGLGGRNQLFIGDAIPGDVVIKQSELFLGRQKALVLRSIQEIHGRARSSEHVEVGCDTMHIALNGGNRDKSDQITIPGSFSSCGNSLSLTISGVGFTQLNSIAMVRGKVDTYLSSDANNQLQFKANLQVAPNIIFNFPIQILSFKLKSYHLKIERAGNDDNDKSVKSIQLKLNLMNGKNFLDFTLKYQNGNYLPQNVNWMFVDEKFNSNGNIFINIDAGEVNILHILKTTEGDSKEKVFRRGAVGAKNVFRLYSGLWHAYGGAMDDSFILNENEFQGLIHGLQGLNSLILTETLTPFLIEIDLLKESMKLMDKNRSSRTMITVKSIQIVGGRKGKKEKITCGCDTRLIMLEGGGSGKDEQDEIYIQDRPCSTEMAMAIVVADFTSVENLAKRGNFTYHVRALQSFSWDIKYIATTETSHAIKLEMNLEKVKEIGIVLEEQGASKLQSLQITFNDKGRKTFPLNFQRLPTFQIGTGPELMADILFPEEDKIVRSSIIARTPFSGVIHGLNGVENGIIVKTSSSLEGIFGGDKDDNIFLSEVDSVLVINAGGGLGRLQLSDELHRGLDLEVDFQVEKISFVNDHSNFVNAVQGIQLFVGREHSFERVVLGCATKSVKWADEVSIRNWKCGYDVKIELRDSTRVMFDLIESKGEEIIAEEVEEEDEESVAGADLEETDSEDGSLDESEEDEDEEIINEPNYLAESIFHYHFTSIRTFDIEIDTFESLRDTRHIFYFNFSLANLTSIRFSLNDSRLIYSTFHDPSLEYSHLVGKLEDTAMFYSQPEFMTTEGFLLRITRYGEVMAVLGAVEETFELDFIHHEVIPRLSSQAERLEISFMVETTKDFIYTGSPLKEEVDLLTNRANTTSHLIGWNGTTYEILDMENDTWIYPQKVHDQDSDSIHVIDLSNIVSPIRSQTGHKYIPEVRQRDGTHLEIVMTNWTEIYPGSIVIANGTELGKSLAILLNSIAMEIIPDIPHGRNRRSLETNWKIKPRPISIPQGYTYILSAEDLEDDVEIKRAGFDNDDMESSSSNNDTLTYGRDNADLVITGINTEDTPEMGRYTSFVIFDYYDPSRQQQLKLKEGDDNENESANVTFTPSGRVESIANIQVNLGQETVKITSNEPILKEETGEEVQVVPYEDILDSVEYEIVKDFPNIPRRFKVSWFQKIGRTPLYRYLFWGVFWTVAITVGILIWVFCRKRDTESDCEVYHVKKTQENFDKADTNTSKNEKKGDSSENERSPGDWMSSWKWVFGKDKKKTYEMNKLSKYGTGKNKGDQSELIPMIGETPPGD